MSAGFIGGTSQIAGMFDGLLRPIVRIFDVIAHLGNILITSISFLISSFLYGLQMGLFILIDMVQSVFRKIAGLDVYWFRESGNTYTQQEGDIVESFLHSDTVWNIFISVLIAAVILLFVSTIIAILKTELNEKDNSKTPVIKNALKAVAYFVIVPVVCVFGVALANIFLRSFDAATANKNAVSISGQIFVAASFDANRVRKSHLASDGSLADVRARLNGIDGFNIRESSSKAEIADALDTAFAHNYSTRVDKAYNFTDLDDYMAGYYMVLGGQDYYHKTNFDKLDITLTYYYYDLMSYNYLIGLWTGGIIVMLLLNLMIGVIQRIFDLTILFIVSPAFIATMPLDEGGRYKKWKEAFIAKTLACYGPIIGINLAFTILTLTQRIYIFDPAGGTLNGLFNALIQCIFVIVAVLSIKDFGKLVNSIVGGDDLYNNKASDVVKAGGQLAGVAMNAAAIGAKVAKKSTIAAAKVGKYAAQGVASGYRGVRDRWQQHKADKEMEDSINQMFDEQTLEYQMQNGGISAHDRFKMQADFQNGMSNAERQKYAAASNEERTEMLNNYMRKKLGLMTQQEAEDAKALQRTEMYEAEGLGFNDMRDMKRAKHERAFRRAMRKDSIDILEDTTKSNVRDMYGSVTNFTNTAGLGKYTEAFNKAGGAQALKDLATHSIDAASIPVKSAYDTGANLMERPYGTMSYIHSEDTLNKIGEYFGTKAGQEREKKAKESKETEKATKAEQASKTQELKLLSDILAQLQRGGGGGTGTGGGTTP